MLGYQCDQLGHDDRGRRRALDRRPRTSSPSPARSATTSRSTSTACTPSRASRSASPRSISYHTARTVPARELVDRCDRTLDRAAELGVAEHLRAAARVARRLLGSAPTSRSTGQPDLQQAVRWNLFQLAQATARTDGDGVAAKGVTRHRATAATTSGTPRSTSCRSSATRPRSWPATCCASGSGCSTPPARRALELNQRGRPVPVAHDQRTGVLGVLRRRHRAVPHRRRHRLSRCASTSRRPATTDFLDRGAIDILVETARMWEDLGLLALQRTGRRRSTSTASPGPTSTRRSSTTTSTRT